MRSLSLNNSFKSFSDNCYPLIVGGGPGHALDCIILYFDRAH